MRNNILLFFIFLITSSLFGNVYLTKLVDQKQYATAWEWLNQQNPTVENTLQKIDFAMVYFTHSKWHQNFSFHNLEKNQNLGEMRYEIPAQTANFVHFPIDTILFNALKKQPKNFTLHRYLGEFYFEVFLIYKDKWLLNRQQLMQLFNQHLKLAYEAGNVSDKGAYALGYFNYFNGKTTKAFDLFETAYQLNPTNSNALYQLTKLSYDYSLVSDSLAKYGPKVIQYGKAAMAVFPRYQTTQLADLAFTIANVYKLQNNCDSAIVYYLISDTYLPQEYDVLEQLLECFIVKNRWKEAEVTASNILNLEVKDIRLFQGVYNLYQAYQEEDKIVLWLDKEIRADIYDKERTGYLKMYLAQSELSGDPKKALDSISNAEADFKICYDPEHPVFLVVDKMKALITQNLK